MPHFRLETNVPKNKIPADFLKQTTGIMAKTLGKPESYCVATVVPDQMMAWGGTTDPCGTATLMSIGKLGVEENKKHTSILHEHITKNLGIPSDRLYITFTDEAAANVGYKGTTFHQIFSGKDDGANGSALKLVDLSDELKNGVMNF